MGRIQEVDNLIAMNGTRQIVENIRRMANTGKPQMDFLDTVIAEWCSSDTLEEMLEAQRYFENRGDIKDKERMVINRAGNLEKAKHLANTKLHHPFLRRLVRQKAVYLLSNPVTVVAEDEKDKPFVDIVNKYIDKSFLRILYILGMQAPVYRYAWLQAYYDASGNLKFKIIPPTEFIPLWGDSAHTWLDGGIRIYTMYVYGKAGEKEEITKIEFYTREGVWYYVKDKDGIHVDDMKYEDVPEELRYEPRGNFKVHTNEVDGEGNPIVREGLWGRVPFICFKYNHEEQTVLQQVKSLIDNYDLTASTVSDDMQDVPNSIKIIKNYDGTDKSEFVHNLSIYRAAFVRDGGDMSQLETRQDITAADSHMNRLRRDMMEAASGVDPQETDMGGYAISGVALKFRYTDLDIDCMAMGNEFKAALEELAWYLAVDELEKNGNDYTNADLDFIFTPVGGINEQELIDSIVASNGVISHQTMLEKHPWVTNLEEEQRRIKSETKEGIFIPLGTTPKTESTGTDSKLITKSNEGNLQHRVSDPINPNAKYEQK